jgi:Mg-chelatase subunit ChlD
MIKKIISRSIWLWLSVVLLLVPLAGQSPGVHAQTQSSSIPNLDIVLIIDESGSMRVQSDPPNSMNQGWRIVMAKLFADLLGVDQSGSTHQISVVLFGMKAEIVQHLTSVQQPLNRSTLDEAIDAAHAATFNNPDFLNTNIPAALDIAYRELDTNGRPDAKKVVIFLSDGKCELQDAKENSNCNQTIRKIIQDRSANNYPIYTIAFTPTAQSGDDSTIYENLWQEIAFQTGGQYYKPDKADEDLLNVYIQIIRNLFNLTQENVPPPVVSPNKYPFDIPAGQLQAVFTVVKYDKNIDVTIIRPNGTPVNTNDSDVRTSTSAQTDSFSIIKPLPGTWYVELAGPGKVTVIFIPFPDESLRVLRLTPPETGFPAGKPMDFDVQVVNKKNEPQVVDDLKADITLPDNTVKTLSFNLEDNTTYLSRLVETTQVGTYSLHFYGQQGDKKVDDTQTILAVNAPWIKISLPDPGLTYPGNQSLPVKAQLMFGTDAVKNPDPNDTVSVLAELVDRNLSSVDQRQLKMDADGAFIGEMKPAGEGTYDLVATLGYIYADGEAFQDVSRVKVKVGGPQEITPSATQPPKITPSATKQPVVPTLTKPPEVTPIPPPCDRDCEVAKMVKTAAILVTLVMLAVLGWIGWWWFNKPSLVGMLETGDMLPPIPLTGKRSVFIGSDPHCAINIQGLKVLPKHAELRPIGSRKAPQVELHSVDPTQLVKVNETETLFKTLRNSDRIKIDEHEFTYNDPADMAEFGTDNPFTPNDSTISQDGSSESNGEQKWTF